jgi:PilZ domain
MAERAHERMPYTVQAEFRTPSSFLVAYSVNLSRGGLFVETEVDIPTGALVTVDFEIPWSPGAAAASQSPASPMDRPGWASSSRTSRRSSAW